MRSAPGPLQASRYRDDVKGRPVDDLDLDAYLLRIGHVGLRSATFETLAALHQAHTAALPFENLDPLLGVPVALDIASLQRKLVQRRRGGWCYEHNLLFGRALRTLGFEVRDLAARVRLNVPEGVQRPRTHMLLLVGVATRRLVVDAGFGGLTLTGPLDLGRRAPQATPHGTFRLLRWPGEYALQAALAGAWQTLYTFDLQPQQPSDYEMASWYLCHHPASIFTQGLMAARAGPTGRHTLRNNRLTCLAADGQRQVRVLTSGAELRGVLEETFGIDVDGLPGVDDRLTSLASSAPFN